MNKYSKYLITIALVALAVTTFVLFELQGKILTTDPIVNSMLGRLIYQLSVGALFIWLIYIMGDRQYLFLNRTTKKKLLWCLPCLLVALVNFPFASLIMGEMHIVRMDLMPLYIIYVISIAVIEEIVFRGILLFLCLDYLRNAKLKYFFAALISTTIFALFHFTNLFVGTMGILDVLLQVGYTFLIGGMFAVMMLKTNNVWLCVIIHALFDFGGLLAFEIADGNPWENPVFWILTIACGILCAGHIIVSLINMEKKHAA